MTAAPDFRGPRPGRLSALAAGLALLCAALPARAGIGIELEGNQAFRTRVLKESLPPDPEEYGEEAMEVWREDALFNLEDLYRRAGYFESRITVAVERKEGRDPKDWVAKVRIEDGPRYAFDSVQVRVLLQDGGGKAAGSGRPVGAEAPSGASGAAAEEGVPLEPDTTAAADTLRSGRPEDLGLEVEDDDLKARVGKPFDQTLLLEDRRFLLRLFGNAGYVRAQVQERVGLRPETRTVRVDYLVAPSYPVVFDTLHVLDRRPPPNDSLPGITREDLLRSLVPYRRGDTVRIGSNDKVIEKLQYTGAFNYVRFKDSLLEDGGGRSALILQAEEQVPGNLRGSIYYETQYGAGLSLDGRHSNLAGNLNEARAGISMATQQQGAYAGYGSPLTYGRLLRFDEDLEATWFQGLPVHKDEGLFGGDFLAESNTRFTFPWSYWLNLVANAQMQAKSRMRDSVNRDRFLNLNFIQTAALSFLNQALDPTRGLRFTFTWGNGGPLFTEDLPRFGADRHNWLEGRTSQYWYYPPLRHFKLATRLDGGRFFGDGEANSELFFLGGSRSIRSYDYQSFCPEKSADGVCVGDDQTLAYWLASAELRMEVFALAQLPNRGLLRHLLPLQVVPFADFARVWDVSEQDAGESRPGPVEGYALGIGTRYPLLGVFNLRLDWVLDGSGPRNFWLDLAQAF